MRALYFIIAFIFFISCKSDKDFDATVYDSYVDSFYEAFVKANIDVRNITEPNWSYGDTVICDRDIHIGKYVNDSLSFITIKASDTMIVSSNLKALIKLHLHNDTTISGKVSKRILQEYQPYYRWMLDKKIEFFDSLYSHKDIIIDSLIQSFNLSEKEFYQIIARENHRRTGEEFINIY